MEKYEDILGKGVKATCLVCDNIEHCVGNLKLLEGNSVFTKEILEIVGGAEALKG